MYLTTSATEYLSGMQMHILSFHQQRWGLPILITVLACAILFFDGVVIVVWLTGLVLLSYNHIKLH